MGSMSTTSPRSGTISTTLAYRLVSAANLANFRGKVSVLSIEWIMQFLSSSLLELITRRRPTCRTARRDANGLRIQRHTQSSSLVSFPTDMAVDDETDMRTPACRHSWSTHRLE